MSSPFIRRTGIRLFGAALLFICLTIANSQAQQSDSHKNLRCEGFTKLGPPSWSADGRIVFAGDCGGRQGMYVFDLDDNSLKELPTRGLVAKWPRWSHTAKEIAFTASDAKEQRDIYLLDVSSGKITRLTSDGSHGGIMSWSPDDQWLGIYGPSDREWNIFRLRRDGSEKIRMNSDNNHRYFNITWSPDGKSYLYTASEAIFLQHNEAEKPARVTPERIHAVMPHWAPDGRTLAFDGNGGDGWEIYLIRPDGTGLVRLTSNDTLDSNASWAPDGKRFAHQCAVDGAAGLCLLELATHRSEPLFHP